MTIEANNGAALTSRAMLVTLTISRWLATRTDKKVSAEVAERYNVEERRAGHFRKFAIDVSTPSYLKLCSASSALRERHYYHSLPWGQEGARILPARNFARYTDDIRRLIAAYDAACAAFYAEYPALKEAAKAELGEMYNESDYPLDIKQHFGARFHVMPLPDAQDFRVQLAADEVVQIRADIEQEMQRTTAEAMREPYQRLFEQVGRMVKQLGNPKGQVRDSLVGNLEELCAILPALNLTNDPQLEQLLVRARGLTQHSPQELRDDSKVRAKVAEQAAQIYDVMAGYMGVQS